MEDAKAPSLLAAIHILAREGTLDARLSAFAREARTVSGGVGALTLLRDVDGGTFATPAGEPLDLDGAALSALRDAAEERQASWSTALPSGLAALAGADRGSIVPLVTANGAGPVVQGVLVVGGGDAETVATRDALTALADLAAVAVEHERLRAALEERGAWQDRVARIDPLTGLADRATFQQMLELEVLRSTRQGTALAVVLVGVDELEPIAATHGGRVADDILRVVAATLADGLRLVDTIARLGPAELGVIAPGDSSGVVARRVIDAVASLPDVGGVTPRVRAGVAHHPSDGTDADELLRAAQGALAQARAGSPATIVGLRATVDAGVAPVS
ncbi:MAG: GGDEF domain-containing protein [Candidatus Limnocylindrales bacterium]